MNCEVAFRIFVEVLSQLCELNVFRNVIIFLVSLVDVYFKFNIRKRCSTSLV